MPGLRLRRPRLRPAAVLTDSGTPGSLGGCGQLAAADIFAAHTAT
ncbi:hypothetical protein [Streptomyces sp. NPDC002172]